jgi:hypothetical protein
MHDPRRLEPPAREDAERDARTEALLVEGLDRYFSGRYEDAIHLWTRVLFLDRSHARARAYIDRARTALAERQRKTDELLQRAGDRLSAGRADEARALLGEAVAVGADEERAGELRIRLERLERASRGVASGARPVAVVDAVPIQATAPRRRTVVLAGLAGTIAAGILVSMVLDPALRERLGFGRDARHLAAVGATAPVPVLSAAEVALIRARTLYARGRLAEALQALGRVGADSAQREDADKLRVEIQQTLLATTPRGLSAIGQARQVQP